MSEPSRKQISYGYLISKADFDKTNLIPPEGKKILKKGTCYLFIFIPGKELLKLSVFPCENTTIKKILIRLKEFSPISLRGLPMC